MAAPTSTYCDYALGNDYKGATFTDGAYTSATKTLTKAGAFAASQVNHWLYLESNDGGSIVAGHYKIATVSSADAVILATDAGAGVDDDAAKCTQHDGTTSKPWRSIQGALDLITRDATNGDQVNVKAGTAQVNQASLTLARYGTPAAGVPLLLRGYTSAAGDGGMGEIDCNGAAFWASTYQYWMMIDLEAHNFGNNNGITGTTNGYYGLVHCEVHKGASTPSGKALVSLNYGYAVGCYIHDAGTGGVGIYLEFGGHALFNYVENCPRGIIGNAIGNIVVGSTTDAISQSYAGRVIVGNTIYSSGSPTGSAINVGTNQLLVILNNIIEGWAGTGAEAIYATTGDIGVIGYNAFFNNTTNESLGDVYVDLGNNASLAASPFTDAAGGDFSLATGVAGAIDGAYPGAWYGPASTTDHADIGAVQNGAGAGGGTVNPLRGKLG